MEIFTNEKLIGKAIESQLNRWVEHMLLFPCSLETLSIEQLNILKSHKHISTKIESLKGNRRYTSTKVLKLELWMEFSRAEKANTKAFRKIVSK